MSKKKKVVDPVNEPVYVPKRAEPDPNKTEDAFMKVWRARHSK